MPGDRLIGNRLAFLKDTPERGDVVIFHYPDDEEELYVKRVIGLPGEEVRIDDGKIYIDGSETPLEEDYLKEEWTVATGPYLFEVPDDCYLVLGDNRNDSWDARYWDNKYVKSSVKERSFTGRCRTSEKSDSNQKCIDFKWKCLETGIV